MGELINKKKLLLELKTTADSLEKMKKALDFRASEVEFWIYRIESGEFDG